MHLIPYWSFHYKLDWITPPRKCWRTASRSPPDTRGEFLYPTASLFIALAGHPESAVPKIAHFINCSGLDIAVTEHNETTKTVLLDFTLLLNILVLENKFLQ